MKELLRRIIRKTPLYYPLHNRATRQRDTEEFSAWEARGKPLPIPHLAKQRTLIEYGKKHDLRILVETGTYYGEMMEAMRRNFDRLYSIELSNELFEKARTRFKRAKHIEIIHGDSGVELGNLMSKLDRATLFWLDGHYSAGLTAKGKKETPIFEELEHIFRAPERGHVIIIDDARCFGSDPAYPSLEELTSFIRSTRRNLEIAVAGDSVRITPSR